MPRPIAVRYFDILTDISCASKCGYGTIRFRQIAFGMRPIPVVATNREPWATLRNETVTWDCHMFLTPGFRLCQVAEILKVRILSPGIFGSGNHVNR